MSSFLSKIMDSALEVRVSDSNERLVEYLQGALRSNALESFALVAPHRDGYRVYVGEDVERPFAYVDVYLDGESLIVEGSSKRHLSEAEMGDLARFLGIDGKEAGMKLNRFRRFVDALRSMSGSDVDALRKLRVSDCVLKDVRRTKIEDAGKTWPEVYLERLRSVPVPEGRGSLSEEEKERILDQRISVALSSIVSFLSDRGYRTSLDDLDITVEGADGKAYLHLNGMDRGNGFLSINIDGDPKTHYHDVVSVDAWFSLLKDSVGDRISDSQEPGEGFKLWADSESAREVPAELDIIYTTADDAYNAAVNFVHSFDGEDFRVIVHVSSLSDEFEGDIVESFPKGSDAYREVYLGGIEDSTGGRRADSTSSSLHLGDVVLLSDRADEPYRSSEFKIVDMNPALGLAGLMREGDSHIYPAPISELSLVSEQEVKNVPAGVLKDSVESDAELLESLRSDSSPANLKRVAHILKDQGRTSLKDGSKEVMAIAEYSNGQLVYSYKQKAWQEVVNDSCKNVKDSNDESYKEELRAIHERYKDGSIAVIDLESELVRFIDEYTIPTDLVDEIEEHIGDFVIARVRSFNNNGRTSDGQDEYISWFESFCSKVLDSKKVKDSNPEDDWRFALMEISKWYEDGDSMGVTLASDLERMIEDNDVPESVKEEIYSQIDKFYLARKQAERYGGRESDGSDEFNAWFADFYVEHDVFNVSDSVEITEEELNEAIHKAGEDTKVDLTEEEKQSGDYPKGVVSIQGLSIAIENPKGSTRSGVDADGDEWSTEMRDTYGYIENTAGADTDDIDVFVGEHPLSDKVFIVDQVKEDGSFDEHKVMLGYESSEDARDAYLRNYEDGWQGLGSITQIDIEDFRRWVEADKTRDKAFTEYIKVQDSNVRPQDFGQTHRIKVDGVYYTNGNTITVDGKRGRVVRFDKDSAEVRFDDGSTITVKGEVTKIPDSMSEGGVSTTKAGEEKYEKFTTRVGRKSRTMYQYDYRTPDGELFSCVAPSLEACRMRRDSWLEKQGAKVSDAMDANEDKDQNINIGWSDKDLERYLSVSPSSYRGRRVSDSESISLEDLQNAGLHSDEAPSYVRLGDESLGGRVYQKTGADEWTSVATERHGSDKFTSAQLHHRIELADALDVLVEAKLASVVRDDARADSAWYVGYKEDGDVVTLYPLGYRPYESAKMAYEAHKFDRMLPLATQHGYDSLLALTTELGDTIDRSHELLEVVSDSADGRHWWIEFDSLNGKQTRLYPLGYRTEDEIEELMRNGEVKSYPFEFPTKEGYELLLEQAEGPHFDYIVDRSREVISEVVKDSDDDDEDGSVVATVSVSWAKRFRDMLDDLCHLDYSAEATNVFKFAVDEPEDGDEGDAHSELVDDILANMRAYGIPEDEVQFHVSDSRSKVSDSEPRRDFIFPADSTVANDGKGHFPLNSLARGRAALAFVARYDKLPKWYSGDMDLEAFKAHVRSEVKKAYPSIEVSEE